MNEFLQSLDWKFESAMALRIVLAAFLGGLLGFEREYRRKEAGIRTFSIVALGACVFAGISSHIPGAEPSRIASNIVVGIGFLGGGVILHENGRAYGLTTAATLWVAAAIGMGVGYGMYLLSTAATLVTLGVVLTHRLFPDKQDDNQGKN